MAAVECNKFDALKVEEYAVDCGLVIAIDGPAGAGKSTVAQRVAARLKCTYVDTGAMYRALTLKALRSGVSIDDRDCLAELARCTTIEFQLDDEGLQLVLLDGDDVTKGIRTPEVTGGVSQVSSVPELRELMVERQREMVSSGGAVMDGRDIGTVVLPNADRKFYLDASPEVRARRRWLELRGRGVDIPLEQVLAHQLARDAHDTQREASPLRAADDAIIVDSGDLSVDEVVALILRHCGFGSEDGSGDGVT